MQARRPTLAWVLLTVPALIIGAAVLFLLRNEGDRVAQADRAAAAARTEVIAEAVRVRLLEWQNQWEEQLRILATSPDRSTAWNLESTHPMIRGTLIVDANNQVLVPDPAATSNPEPRDRLQRYNALLSGRVPWKREDTEIDPPQPQVWQAERSRNQLRYYDYKQQTVADPEPATVYWHPWQWEDRQFLLATAPTITGGWCAIEIETVALLSRLYDILPKPTVEGRVIELQSRVGTTVHRQVHGTPADPLTPLASADIGSLLPYYLVTLQGPPITSAGSGSLPLLAVSFTLFLVATIWVGGWLMMRESRRHLRDAQQKTSFVSNVSHELKTPLTSIRMYAELLEEDRIPDEDRQKKALHTMANESRRLSRLVDNVLDFSRLEQNRKDMQPEAIHLPEFLEDRVSDLRWRATEASVDLSSDCDATLPPVWFDRDALEQIVINLVDNACKYGASGGEVVLAATPGKEQTFLTVSDRGPGIPAAQRERIFEQFHRLDDSLTAAHSGAGLGLSIARRLAEQGGGTLSVVARDGGGCTFQLALPTQPAGDAT